MILARDSRGRYFHVNSWVKSKVLVFDRHGGYLGAFGRNGQGPGEFNSINALFVGRGDTLHIFDQGRYLVYSPSLRHARTIGTGTGQVWGFAELSPGLRVVGTAIKTRDRFGYPLHFLSATSLGRAFGMTEAPPSGLPPDPNYLDRMLVRASGSTFWAVHMWQYTLDLWDRNGALLRRLGRKVSWFDIKPRTSLEGRYNPVVTCLLRDTADRLWIVAKIRDSRFRDLFEFVGPEIGPYHIRNIRPKSGRSEDYYSTNDSVIEVIDTHSGEAIATLRLDTSLLGCPDQSSVYTYEEQADGTGRLVVWRLSLDAGTNRRGQ